MPAREILGQNHFAHSQNTLGIEEHVLGAAQSDAFSAEPNRRPGIRWRFGIGANAKLADLVRPAHQGAKVAGHFGLYRLNLAQHDLTAAAVNSDDVAGGNSDVANVHRLRLVIDPQLPGA